MNTEVWDRIAARARTADVDDIPDAIAYAPDGPTEADLRLFGDVADKRVLDLGTGSGTNAIALARQGAHVIALDRSVAQLARARKLAAATDVRVEWHECDVADLAFLRADSIDLVVVDRCRVDEFVCRSCFLVRTQGQLADGAAMVCRDCSG